MKNFLFEVLRQIVLNQTVILDEISAKDNIVTGTVRAKACLLIREIDDALGKNAPNMNTSDPRINWKAGDTAIIKDHWEGAGQKLQVLGSAVFLKQWWVPVEDSEDADPTFHKEAALEKEE